MLKASVYGNTDTGLVRTNNEDSYIAQTIWDNNHWLLAVIDGLGGYEGGEVAATIAKGTVIEAMDKYSGRDCLDVVMQAVTDANNAIYNKRIITEGLEGMGCVMTAAILDLSKRQLNVAHVGDTRLYRYVNGQLEKLTHDHSFVGTLEDEGRISEEDAMKHPRRNLIDRIVGDEQKDVNTSCFIEAAVFPIANGQQYLLCSDGLSDMLTSSEMASVLHESISPKKKVQKLIKSANEHGGKDNISAIVANVFSAPHDSRFTRRNNVTKAKKTRKNKRNICDVRTKEEVTLDGSDHRGKSFLYGFSLTAIVIFTIIITTIVLIRIYL